MGALNLILPPSAGGAANYSAARFVPEVAPVADYDGMQGVNHVGTSWGPPWRTAGEGDIDWARTMTVGANEWITLDEGWYAIGLTANLDFPVDTIVDRAHLWLEGPVGTFSSQYAQPLPIPVCGPGIYPTVRGGITASIGYAEQGAVIFAGVRWIADKPVDYPGLMVDVIKLS